MLDCGSTFVPVIFDTFQILNESQSPCSLKTEKNEERVVLRKANKETFRC